MLMMLDVETDGLLGETFAVGYSLFDYNGVITLEEFKHVVIERKDQWVKDNVPIFDLQHALPNLEELRAWFVRKFRKWQPTLVVDHCYPCESGFLKQCSLEHHITFYPVIDMYGFINTLKHTTDIPDLDDVRLLNEIPAHHPINDCRQSIRQYLHFVKELRKLK